MLGNGSTEAVKPERDGGGDDRDAAPDHQIGIEMNARRPFTAFAE